MPAPGDSAILLRRQGIVKCGAILPGRGWGDALGSAFPAAGPGWRRFWRPEVGELAQFPASGLTYDHRFPQGMQQPHGQPTPPGGECGWCREAHPCCRKKYPKAPILPVSQQSKSQRRPERPNEMSRDFGSQFCPSRLCLLSHLPL